MAGAMLAASPILGDPAFIVKLSAILIIGLPICFFVHGSCASRLMMNWIAFGASLVLGTLELATHWPYQASTDTYAGPVALLLRFFLWVMVFRSLAIRTLSDAVETTIPAVSVLLLVLIVQPETEALAGVALVTMGTLALLAQEHEALADASSDPIRRLRTKADNSVRVRRRRPSLYSWPTLYVAVILVATITGATASYLQVTNQWGQDLQILLARKLAGLMSRDNYSYLPDSRIVLDGRPPSNSDRVLFRVKANIAANWRYTAYETYTGRTWGRARYRSIRASRDDKGYVFDPTTMGGFYKPATAPVSYEIVAEVPLGGSLPVALWPTHLESGVRGVRTDEVGTVMCTGYVMPGQEYQVEAALPSLSSITSAGTKPVLGAAMRERCLALPDSVPQRVRDLAQSIIAGEPTPLARVISIQSYLNTKYRYDLSPPLPRPGEDFVDHFLFEGKRGYCQHFASAMTVMCRCIGLPARMASGFTEGDYDAVRDRYMVREKDMHTWPEVFLPDRGWMPFEPTPPEDERSKNPFAAAWKSASEFAHDESRWIGQVLETRGLFVLFAFTYLVGAIALLSAGRHKRLWAVRCPDKGADPRGRCVFAYRQMRRWLICIGQPDARAVPPLEYVAQVQEGSPELGSDASGVAEAYVEARFASGAPPETTAEEAEAALERIRGAIKTRKARKGLGA